MEKLFTTAQVAVILNISHKTLSSYLAYHPELKPEKWGRGGRLSVFTVDEIRRIAKVRGIVLSDGFAKTETAISESAMMPAPAETAGYTSPIDMLITIDKTINEDPNVKAYYDMKNTFENMNEQAIQKLFAPLLERFKYAYICKVIPEIQSQLLTCISRGKLRGMTKYKLDFNAFLKLIKFAHDNYVPLDAPDFQK